MATVSTRKGQEIPASRAAVRARKHPRGLAHGLVQGLSERIRSGSLKPGAKLPTEAEIMEAYAVSRTVVREALSRLQASGMVETRHGIGTFVLDAPLEGGGFRVSPSDLATAVDVLAVLELRISLETESAGLAAQRKSPAQLAEMRAALDAFEAHIEEAGNAVPPDFRFHMAIASATGNRYFADILAHLGAAVIPRTRIDSSKLAQEDMPSYLRRVNREHEEILQAIERGDAESARAAMRIHLTNSRERLRRAQKVVR